MPEVLVLKVDRFDDEWNIDSSKMELEFELDLNKYKMKGIKIDAIYELKGFVHLNQKPIEKDNVGWCPTNPFSYDYLTAEEFKNFFAKLYNLENKKNNIFDLPKDQLIKDFTETLVIAADAAGLGADVIQQLQHVLVLFGNLAAVTVLKDLDLGQGQAVGLVVRGQDFEALHAERGDAQQAVVTMLPVANGGGCADRVNIRVGAGFITAVY